MEVCIIGGGLLSIISAKIALENGLRPFILSKSTSFGGLWQSLPTEVGVWDSMRTNSNKFQFTFSDMLWNAEDPDFPNGKHVLNYLHQYIQKHSLTQYFNFQCTVIEVCKLENNYKVTWTNSNETYTKCFEYVIIAVGRCSKDYSSLKNPSIFKGDIIYGSRYREPSIFQGKKVVCIGRSYTGSDIACDALKFATEVTQVYSRNYIIRNKHINGVPFEFIFLDVNCVNKSGPLIADLQGNIEKTKSMIKIFGNPGKYHPLWEIDPNTLSDFTIFSINNEDYLEAVSQRRINIIQGRVEGFYESGLLLSDGRQIEADSVVLGLGYTADYNFLSEEIKNIVQYNENDSFLPTCLYRGMLHPSLPKMCFLGNYISTTPGRFEMCAEIGIKHFLGTLNVTEDELWQGVRDEEFIRQNLRSAGTPYLSSNFIVEQMRLLGVKLDMEYIRNELKFEKGPLLPQFFYLDKPEIRELAKTVVQQIKERYPFHKFSELE